MHKWEIRTHASGRPRVIDVRLYKSRKELRAAATRWCRTAGTDDDFTGAGGVCHGFRSIWIDDDGTETEQELCAIVRLSETDLTPLVVSHEIAHAAQHIYGLDLLPEGANAAECFTAGNEDFAYLMGELFAAAWRVLRNAETRSLNAARRGSGTREPV